MSKTSLIIKREYLTRVRNKSFIIMTLLGPLITGGLIGGLIYMGMSDSENQKILVVDETPGLFRGFTDERGLTFEYIDGISLEKAQVLVHETDYTACLYIPRTIISGNKGTFFFKDAQPGYRSHRLLEEKVSNIVKKEKIALLQNDTVAPLTGQDINRIEQLNTKVSLGMAKLTEPGKSETVNTEGALIAFYFGLSIYMFIFMYGVMVMRGVIEEKTNRIVEVMISTVKPFQLMMGKILGIALVAITQFTLWVALTSIILLVVQTVVFSQYDPETLTQTLETMTPEVQEQYMAEEGDLTKVLDKDNPIFHINWPASILFFILFFIGGYFLYSALFAAIGSAVDQESDTQQFMMPVTMPLIFGLVASFMIIINPDSAIVVWLSHIPLTSPIVMLVRVVTLGIGEAGVPIWEVLLSLVVLYASFIGTTWLAGRIYRTGILMYGKKVSWKELFKWLTYKS